MNQTNKITESQKPATEIKTPKAFPMKVQSRVRAGARLNACPA